MANQILIANAQEPAGNPAKTDGCLSTSVLTTLIDVEVAAKLTLLRVLLDCR
jgi:hypothetical protein